MGMVAKPHTGAGPDDIGAIFSAIDSLWGQVMESLNKELYCGVNAVQQGAEAQRVADLEASVTQHINAVRLTSPASECAGYITVIVAILGPSQGPSDPKMTMLKGEYFASLLYLASHWTVTLLCWSLNTLSGIGIVWQGALSDQYQSACTCCDLHWCQAKEFLSKTGLEPLQAQQRF